jgi:hypothetical protein
VSGNKLDPEQIQPHRTYTGGWEYIQEDGTADRSTKKIDNADKEPLRYDDAELVLVCLNYEPSLVTAVPGFKYWELDERRKMCKPNNVCGYQQRSFEAYWVIRHGMQRGKIFLGIGSSAVIAPSMFGTDKYCGVPPPSDRYNAQGYPHMMVDSDKPLPFFSDGPRFAGVTTNHVIEHLEDPAWAIDEWLRVTEEGGYVCIVTPDMAYSRRGSIDPTHIHEFSADEFLEMLQDGEYKFKCPFEIVEHNTFDNMFSFNTVLRRL